MRQWDDRGLKNGLTSVRLLPCDIFLNDERTRKSASWEEMDGHDGGYSNPMNQVARLRGRAIFRFESVRSA